MEARLRSAITLAVLAVVLVLAALWGWSAVSQPFPEQAEAPVCVDAEFAKGDRISRSDVTVSVYNAGTRVGLAGLTMDLLVDEGFAQGSEGNAPDQRKVGRVQIWTEEPKSPAVRLVASHFRKAKVVRREADAPGVMVVVGDNFEDLQGGRRGIKAKQATTVCGPPPVT